MDETATHESNRSVYSSKTFLLLIANLVGMFAVAGLIAIGPQQPPVGEEPGPGDGMYFAFLVLPLLAAFCILNVFALVTVWFSKRSKKSRAYKTLVALCALWPMSLYLSLKLMWVSGN
jgi:FtsH-binding integral membrane protein